MDWGSPEFVIAVIAICYMAWLANNWIRARNGYALEDEWGGKTERADSSEAAKLREQNQQLREVIKRMEDRMRVLERIVTDPGTDLSRQIETLREDHATREETAS